MSILSTNKNLIKVVSQEYSEGSGISIDDYVISFTGVCGDQEVNSFVYDNSATIIDVNSSYKANSGTFLTAIPSQYATTGDLEDLSTSISETYQVKGDYLVRSDSSNFYPMTGNPSGFLTAHQSLDGYATQDWVTAQGYITGVDLSEYAKRTDVLSSIESATSGKLDVSSFASLSSDFLTNEDLNGYATESFVENVSGDITALIPTNYATTTQINELSGNIDYISGQVDNKLDTTSFSDVSGSFLTAHQDLSDYATTTQVNELSGAIDYVSANAGDQEVHNIVHTNSATWDSVTNKLDTTAFSDVSGSFLTAHQDLSDYATTADLALKQDTLTFGFDEQNKISAINNSAIASQGGVTGEFVPLSSFNELKQSYDALSSLFATYSGQWLLPNEGV